VYARTYAGEHKNVMLARSSIAAAHRFPTVTAADPSRSQRLRSGGSRRNVPVSRCAIRPRRAFLVIVLFLQTHRFVHIVCTSSRDDARCVYVMYCIHVHGQRIVLPRAQNVQIIYYSGVTFIFGSRNTEMTNPARSKRSAGESSVRFVFTCLRSYKCTVRNEPTSARRTIEILARDTIHTQM